VKNLTPATTKSFPRKTLRKPVLIYGDHKKTASYTIFEHNVSIRNDTATSRKRKIIKNKFTMHPVQQLAS